MTDTQPAQERWTTAYNGTSKQMVMAGRQVITYQAGSGTNAEIEERASLIARLANLYFAGTARAAKRTIDVLATGDMPADPDYGLTENEIAAGRMMNALMDENAKLLEALENIENDDEHMPPSAWALIQSAIAKSKGDS